jgi:hypothetical protein
MDIQVRDPRVRHREPRVFNPVVTEKDAEEILKQFGWKKDESKSKDEKRPRRRE